MNANKIIIMYSTTLSLEAGSDKFILLFIVKSPIPTPGNSANENYDKILDVYNDITSILPV